MMAVVLSWRRPRTSRGTMIDRVGASTAWGKGRRRRGKGRKQGTQACGGSGKLCWWMYYITEARTAASQADKTRRVAAEKDCTAWH